MTKEKLYEIMLNSISMTEIRDTLDLFFKSNVCIPKGNNRHPYADVLHQAIEGASLEGRFPRNDNGKWTFASIPSVDFEYRIKPSEPIYEWQWLHMSKQSNVCIGFTQDYYAENEVDNDVYNWVKIESTKRARQ